MAKLSNAPDHLRAQADGLLAEIKQAGIQYVTLYRDHNTKKQSVRVKLYGLNPKRSPNVDKWLEANGFVIERPKGSFGYRGVTSATVYVNDNYIVTKAAPLVPLDKKEDKVKYINKRFIVHINTKDDLDKYRKFCDKNGITFSEI